MCRQAIELVTAIGSLVAACSALPGRIVEARRRAVELAGRRRIRVQTEVATAGGVEVVLRTWVRLFGDTQTDILKSWVEHTKPESAQATIQAHFDAVAASTRFLDSLRMFALATNVLAWFGFTGIAFKPLWPLLETQEWGAIIPTMLDHWRWPLAGLALPVFHLVVRWALRWRLRQVFSRSLIFANF
jgi:hypothetical protein